MAPPTKGWLIYPPKGELQQLAQRVVCWSGHDKRVQIGTAGGTHLIVPFEVCGGTPLALTPGAPSDQQVVCAVGVTPTGWTVVTNLTADQVSGLNSNSCTEVTAPTGLAVTGTPTATAITVHWSAPAGYTPTGYRLRYRVTGTTGAYTTVDVAAGTLSRAVTGLTVNTSYDFQVQAKQGTDVVSPFTAVTAISTAAS
jgi:hypothetical protein